MPSPSASTVFAARWAAAWLGKSAHTAAACATGAGASPEAMPATDRAPTRTSRARAATRRTAPPRNVGIVPWVGQPWPVLTFLAATSLESAALAAQRVAVDVEHATRPPAR